MSFGNDIIKFSEKSIEKCDKIRRGVILKLFSAVIDDTPVDTGLLRGNWLTSVNRPKNYQIKTPDASGSIAKGKIDSNMGELGDTVYLSNNLPYAVVAEYGGWNGETEKVTAQGYSKQAPAGMVRKNVARFKQILKSVPK